jgi:hypothetical protein
MLVDRCSGLTKIVKPLVQKFYGPNVYAAQCQSNAGARLLHGSPIHASTGLNPTSSMNTAALKLSAQAKIKLALKFGPVGAIVIDEASQVSGELLHADNLRVTYARCAEHILQPQLYMKSQHMFGCVPLLIISGDYLQLPPIPERSSVLFPATQASHEQKQGRAMVQNMPFCV